MIFRPARESDIPGIVDLAQAMHAESPHYAGVTFCPLRASRAFWAFLQREDVFLWVALDDTGLAGVYGGWVEEYYWSPDLVAFDLGLFVPPGKRGSRAAVSLLRAFEHWAVSQGAVLICPGVTAGKDPDRAARFYERYGYTRSGITLRKEV